MDAKLLCIKNDQGLGMRRSRGTEGRYKERLSNLDEKKQTQVAGKLQEDTDSLILNFDLFAFLQGKSTLHFSHSVGKGLVRFAEVVSN